MEQKAAPKISRWLSSYTFFNGLPILKYMGIGAGTEVPRPNRDAAKLVENNHEYIKMITASANRHHYTWGTLDDVIMGGNSCSHTGVMKDDKNESFIRFQGKTSLKGGGFVSTRTRNFTPTYDLRGMEGISLRVKSKQNFIYNLIIRDNSDWNGMTWVADFEVQAQDEEWQTIELPWSAFSHKNS